jgi:hypothetical protein
MKEEFLFLGERRDVSKFKSKETVILLYLPGGGRDRKILNPPGLWCGVRNTLLWGLIRNATYTASLGFGQVRQSEKECIICNSVGCSLSQTLRNLSSPDLTRYNNSQSTTVLASIAYSKPWSPLPSFHVRHCYAPFFGQFHTPLDPRVFHNSISEKSNEARYRELLSGLTHSSAIVGRKFGFHAVEGNVKSQFRKPTSPNRSC